MENLKSKKWWIAAGTRAIKTISQTVLGLIGTSLVITDVDWKVVVSASLLAGFASLVTSLNGLPEANETYKLGE